MKVFLDDSKYSVYTEQKMSSTRIFPFQGLRENVAQLLRNAICDGSFRPGDSLKDTALAARFQVSRSPIREALLQLEKEGLVKNYHNQGWFVIDLTPEEIVEITSLRAVMEVLALQLAAENISKRELAKIREIEEGFRTSFDAADFPAVCRCDFAFHQAIWSASGHRVLNETLLQVARPYFAYFQAVICAQGMPVEECVSTVRNHGALVDYLAGARDRTAEELIREHLGAMSLKNWDVLLKRLSK